jgi:homocysteine S-methyltransferase
MGTELQRRGVQTRLPLWSSWALLEAPETVGAIHREYAEAGADIITTNTFRTHRRSLAEEGIGERAKELTRLAVELAERAREHARADVCLAGSMAPLEDCYHPERVPARDRLETEHAEMAENLAEAGVDLLLVETMGTLEEIGAAARAARGTGLPFMVSAIPREGGRLLGRQSLAEMVRILIREKPLALMVNCANHRVITAAIEVLLKTEVPVPVGGYANMGSPEDQMGWSFRDEVSPRDYASKARDWERLGARVVGGCCGTTPAHIKELAGIFKTSNEGNY